MGKVGLDRFGLNNQSIPISGVEVGFLRLLERYHPKYIGKREKQRKGETPFLSASISTGS